jgi:hypothetical protein
VARLLELLALLERASEPGATPPAFDITGIDLLTASVRFSADLEPDGVVDATGSVAFRDAAGNPTIPFDPLSPPATVEELLQGLPDGTTVVTTFLVPEEPVTVGTISTVFQGGQPDTASGTVLVDGVGCDSTFVFEDVPAGPLLAGAWPVATADLTLAGAEGALDGTVTFDGTSTATIVASIDDSTFTFLLDLVTGEVTQVP